MFEMCNHKNPLTTVSNARMAYRRYSRLLREERCDELENATTRRADGEFYQPRSGKRYFFARNQNGQPFLRYGHAG